MKIEEKIQMLFTQVIEKYGGNKKAAADSLGINAVTFWGWVKGRARHDNDQATPKCC